jgi:hypothetical protein
VPGAFQPDAFQNDAFQGGDGGASPNAGLASGTGTATNAIPRVLPHPLADASAGTANDATVSLNPNVEVDAGLATGTGVSHNAVAATALTNASAGVASGLGFVPYASPLTEINEVFVEAEVAEGEGEAYGRAVTTARAGLAQGQGWGKEAGVRALAAPLAGPGNAGDVEGAGSLPRPTFSATGVLQSHAVVIRYDGQDITSEVMFASARFMSSTKGAPGTCSMRVRDTSHVHEFVQGKSLTLDISGKREWTGFLASVKHGYYHAGTHALPSETARYFDLQGVDLNILFQKRVLYNKTDPTEVFLTTFDAGSPDRDVVLHYAANHLDLSSDSLDIASRLEHIGTPEIDTDISGAGGWSWGDFMKSMTRNTGAIYYISPGRELVLTDVDTPDSPFGITDTPAGAVDNSYEGVAWAGCRDLEVDEAGENLRNDAFAWGIGQGSANPVFQRTSDEDSIDDYGLWQVAAKSQAVWRQETIERIANSLVHGSVQNKRGGKNTAESVRATIFQQGIQAGMKVPVYSDGLGFEDILPVRACEVTFPTPYDAQWTLFLSHEIDDPWTTSEFWMPNWAIPPIDIGVPTVPVPNLPDFPGFPFPPFPGGGLDCEWHTEFSYETDPETGWQSDPSAPVVWDPIAGETETYTHVSGGFGVVDLTDVTLGGSPDVFYDTDDTGVFISDGTSRTGVFETRILIDAEEDPVGFPGANFFWGISFGRVAFGYNGHALGFTPGVLLNYEFSSQGFARDFESEVVIRAEIDEDGIKVIWNGDEYEFKPGGHHPSWDGGGLTFAANNDEDTPVPATIRVDYMRYNCADSIIDFPISGPIFEAFAKIGVPSGESSTSTYWAPQQRMVAGTERVYLNGILLRPGEDYSLNSPEADWVEIFDDTPVLHTDVVSGEYEVAEPAPLPPPVDTDEIQGTPSDWLTKWASADPGDVIRLIPGTYSVGGSSGQNAPASGTSGNPISIKGGPGVVFEGGGDRMCMWIRDAHDIVMEDIRITNYATEGTGVFVFEDSHDITLNHVTMDDVRSVDPVRDGHYNDHGFYFGGGCVDITLNDCGVRGEILRGGAVHAFHPPGAINCLVDGGVFTGADWGVLWDSDGSGNVIQNGDYRGNFYGSIRLNSGGVSQNSNLVD